ncbi:protein of unknown function DUF114 [Ferroglobus placidus DSM 10642]|uniref:Periplasmic serine protease n=1 Tax=Ferroglobus placidus (strain DSM 10642 / AEDII12DO) TaxID=589924 RepID=D3S126_FERPA|nr:ATP-dependent Clp protease proteolytic subunit [Ferroglobus placidus]ADC64262.1 protein of unknown function DUF114 [Ferroglobus placidus DSM 10642]
MNYFDPFSIFWFLLFFYLLISPQLNYRRLQMMRVKAMERLSRVRGSSVITLIHRQERIGLLGIPFYRFINIEDSEQVLRAIRMTPRDTPIDLILHTPGGLVLAATQIAKAIKDHPAKTTVIVPHYAMSGGTLIAIAADEIIMDPHAVLGPLDPQIMGYPAPSILKAVERKDVNEVDDQTLILADVAEKAIKQLREFIVELLEDRMGREKAEEIAKTLTEGRWTHDYPLTPEELKKMGFNVKTEVPKEVYELMELYPQPMFQREVVEFVPRSERVAKQ